MTPTTRPNISFVIGLGVLGVVVGALGSTVHRLHHEIFGDWIAVGILLAFAATAAGSLFARALADWAGVFAYAAGWLIAVLALSIGGPGYNVVIAADTLGYLWSYLGVFIAIWAVAAPKKWLRESAPVSSSDTNP